MEMAELIRFKTATLTAFGLQRNGVWGEETASQKIEHLGLMFGALAAHPRGPVRGYGVPPHHLTFGLLVFPSIWDIHDLRHTFASTAVASGQGLPMIGKLLGHTQVQTTARYAHLAAEPVRMAADAVAASLKDALAG